MRGLRSDRRRFLTGLLAAGLLTKPSWADAGAPAYLSAAARRDGSFLLCGIGEDLEMRFQIPLPARGHAGAAHPMRPEAVAFARRPGTFALVIDCLSGKPTATLTAPKGRHFYGHGTYSADGDWLFTTENDYEAGRGRIGVWNALDRYARVGEFASGGVGPHDIKRLPGTNTLVIANGGIDTHPETGRTKLNIPTMRPNLTYVTDGKLTEQVALPAEMHKNSIRHLAVESPHRVAFGMQWQGDGPATALVGQHELGGPMSLFTASAAHLRQMAGYIGSIAYAQDQSTIAVTSPRGGFVHFYDAEDRVLVRQAEIPDVCGVSSGADGLIFTSGTGDMHRFSRDHVSKQVSVPLKWDNHLVRI